MVKKKYDEDDIVQAIKNMLDSWDMDTILDFAYERLYDDYMDRSQPIENIDELMEEWGPKGHRINDNEGYFGA